MFHDLIAGSQRAARGRDETRLRRRRRRASPQTLSEATSTDDRLGACATAHELVATTRVGVADEKARSGKPGWVALVAEYLNDCYRSPPSLAELAREAGVSPEHLARVFRGVTGLTVGQFVRLRRVLEGAERLREPRADLSDVAYSCGYSDQSHFTREFRRHLGTTPRASSLAVSEIAADRRLSHKAAAGRELQWSFQVRCEMRQSPLAFRRRIEKYVPSLS